MSFIDEVINIRADISTRRSELRNEIYHLEIKLRALEHELEDVDAAIAKLDKFSILPDAQEYLQSLKGSTIEEEK